MSDIMGQLREAGFEPQIVEDGGGFSPITGKYQARIDSLGRVQGESKKDGTPYDFYSLAIQVVEILEGDKATNRFLKLTYNNDGEGVKKLLNDLMTAGITVSAKSDEELASELEGLKDKVVSVRCWVWTPDKDRAGNELAPENRKAFQQIRVVKGFGKNGGKPSTVKSNIPF